MVWGREVMKLLKTLYQTDWYTQMHIMNPALSLRITVCMRVVHTEDSIASDDIYSKFMHDKVALLSQQQYNIL